MLTPTVFAEMNGNLLLNEWEFTQTTGAMEGCKEVRFGPAISGFYIATTVTSQDQCKQYDSSMPISIDAIISNDGQCLLWRL
jgi:K+-transporting ATPase A subunit